MTELDKLTRYGPIVARCRSASEPSKLYEVRRHPEQQTYSCTCKAWIFRKSCKHTKAAEATEGRSGIVELNRSRQIVMKVQGAGYLAEALDQMRVDVGEAVQRDAEKVPRQASRPILMVRSGALQEREIKGPKAAKDPIAAEARDCAQALGVSTQVGIRRIERAIRKFAGSASAAVALPIQAERGVREIILED